MNWKIPADFGGPLSYANKEMVEKHLRAGCAKARFGNGEWIDRKWGSERIVGIWAFYLLNGRVATFEHPKMNDGIANRHGQPYEKEYSATEFEAYCKEWKITLSERETSPQEILALWPENLHAGAWG